MWKSIKAMIDDYNTNSVNRYNSIKRELVVLDENIIKACNDLINLKAQTVRQRADFCNQKERLQRICDQKHEEWRETMRIYRANRRELQVYQHACQKAFNCNNENSSKNDGMFVPAFAVARQAQLCHHLHIMASDEHQIHQMKEQNKALELFVLNLSRQMQEDQAIIERQLLNAIVNLQLDIRNLETQIQKEDQLQIGKQCQEKCNLDTKSTSSTADTTSQCTRSVASDFDDESGDRDYDLNSSASSKLPSEIVANNECIKVRPGSEDSNISGNDDDSNDNNVDEDYKSEVNDDTYQQPCSVNDHGTLLSAH